MAVALGLTRAPLAEVAVLQFPLQSQFPHLSLQTAFGSAVLQRQHRLTPSALGILAFGWRPGFERPEVCRAAGPATWGLCVAGLRDDPAAEAFQPTPEVVEAEGRAGIAAGNIRPLRSHDGDEDGMTDAAGNVGSPSGNAEASSALERRTRSLVISCTSCWNC